MPRYPHERLFYDPRRVVVLSGPHIQVLDTASDVVRTEDNILTDDNGPIRCSGMSKDGRYLATTGDDKQLKIWDLESSSLLSSQGLPKKPTSIWFTTNADVLVSDKFGDAFRYSLQPKNELVKDKDSSEKRGSHESTSDGELVLGHASLLTSCLLTPDEKFIITADRDEHIRVSWYPEGYNIQSYCLGHKKYVSAIHIPAAFPARLISGGGDPCMKVWDWMTGRLLRDVAVFDVVEPFIPVAQNGGHKSSSRDSSELPNAMPSVFVVRRIGSFLLEGETHVVFSAVGATAIFGFILAETTDQPDIRHHDFGKPVIDFTLCDDGLIWVLLDADFRRESNISDEHPRKLVQAVRWSVDGFVDAGNSTLLEYLNTVCALPATSDDLKALDLYSDLYSLPKNIEVERGAGSIHGSLASDASNPVGLTKRALGRLKHKRALCQLDCEQVEDGDTFEPDVKKIKGESDSDA